MPVLGFGKRQWGTFCFGLVVGLGILAWLIFHTDRQALLLAFGSFNLLWVPLLGGIYLAGFCLRAIRWRIMLGKHVDLPFSGSFAIITIGYMVNNILPLRLGEILRAGVLKHRHGASGTLALSSIMLERLLDGLATLGMLAMGLSFAGAAMHAHPVVKAMADTASVVFLVVSVGVIAARCLHSVLPTLAEKTLRPLGETPARLGRSLAVSVGRAFEVMNVDTRFASVVLLTVCIWLVEAGMFLAGFAAFGLPVSLPAAFAVLAVVNLGVFLPIAPANMGVFHACTVVAFETLGLPGATGVSYALVLHAVQTLLVVVLGGLFMRPGDLNIVHTLRTSRSKS